MQVTLFHNPTSGAADHSPGQLCKLLRRCGYDAAYQSTKEGWEHALDWAADLVVIAGGDGTVDKVLPRMAGRGIPVGIIPVGTANNIAAALHALAAPEDVVAGWRPDRRRPFDVGIATGPWGTKPFVEAVGLGAFPQLLPGIRSLSNARRGDRDRQGVAQRLQRDAAAIGSLFSASRPARWQLTVDGGDASGEFLLLEAMNIDAIGPGLRIAPHADPSDGLLDVVLISAGEQEAFQEYLDRLAEPRDGPVNFPVRRAARVEFFWAGSLLHIDGEVWGGRHVALDDVHTADHFEPGSVTLQVMKHAVEVLVPEIG